MIVSAASITHAQIVRMRNDELMRLHSRPELLRPMYLATLLPGEVSEEQRASALVICAALFNARYDEQRREDRIR